MSMKLRLVLHKQEDRPLQQRSWLIVKWKHTLASGRKFLKKTLRSGLGFGLMSLFPMLGCRGRSSLVLEFHHPRSGWVASLPAVERGLADFQNKRRDAFRLWRSVPQQARRGLSGNSWKAV